MSNIVPIAESHEMLPARRHTEAMTLEQKWWLAQRIASTEFVPKAFRNRPEAAFAAMLYGAERGFSELEALNNIHVIEGKPTLSAEAMRALVLAAGHTIEIIESTAQRATVVGRRAGSDTTSPPFTWTLDRARRARLANRPNWQMHPEQMLLARASAELCRAVFADVVAGLVATEEFDDVAAEPEPTVRRKPPTRRPARVPPPARAATPAATASVPPATPQPAQAAETDLGGIPGADQPSWGPAAPVKEPPNKSTAAFTRRLNAELNKAFPDADKTTRDRYRHALVAVVTRDREAGPIVSSTELSEAEQMGVSKALVNVTAGVASIADGPDGTVELRSRRGWYSVAFEPLTVTFHPAPSDGEKSARNDDDTPLQPGEQATLDDEHRADDEGES